MVILKNFYNFRIDLTEKELELAEKMYQYTEDPSKVDYSKFKEDIDIIFTKSVNF